MSRTQRKMNWAPCPAAVAALCGAPRNVFFSDFGKRSRNICGLWNGQVSKANSPVMVFQALSHALRLFWIGRAREKFLLALPAHVPSTVLAASQRLFNDSGHLGLLASPR